MAFADSFSIIACRIDSSSVSPRRSASAFQVGSFSRSFHLQGRRLYSLVYSSIAPDLTGKTARGTLPAEARLTGGNPMAITTEAPAPAQAYELTYEAYMAEPTVYGRYDIVNGVRIFMAGASYRHQRVSNNISRAFYRYEQAGSLGTTVSAPFDVLIRRSPRMQTRQPDVLFISSMRLAAGGGIPIKGPFNAAPELVVEIISDSETQRILGDKIADYITIGVDECWAVRPDAGTVEVLALTPNGASSVAVYGKGEEVQSVAFAGLTAAVADVFAA